jgi:hypothetical protein
MPRQFIERGGGNDALVGFGKAIEVFASGEVARRKFPMLRWILEPPEQSRFFFLGCKNKIYYYL